MAVESARARTLTHADPAGVPLQAALDALADPVRRSILRDLASHEDWTRARRTVVLEGGIVAGTTMASADPTPTPAPSYKQVTLSPEESQKLCAERLPKMIARRDKLAARINGGADVKGSVAWLKARAAQQKAKGH